MNDTNKEDCFKITKIDFYSPQDTRYYQSGVDDIVGGDNFIDYIEYFLDLYEDDLFDN